MAAFSFYRPFNGAQLFTVVCLPDGAGRCPMVLNRTPYADPEANCTDAELVARRAAEARGLTTAGFGVVFQHCRGHGKSDGEFIPYINERADGTDLIQWVRESPYYNGEIYLSGGSYNAALWVAVAPFPEDVKGLYLQVQDCDRYSCNYRNGMYKIGLHGGWTMGVTRPKGMLANKRWGDGLWNTLPARDIPEYALGVPEENWLEILRHPDRDDPFWQSEDNGAPQREAVMHCKLPILFVTGFYDIFVGGCMDVWRDLDPETRARCALAITPFDHSTGRNASPYPFPGGEMSERFGDFVVNWFRSVRGECPPPVPPGKVSYYRLFDDVWDYRTDDLSGDTREITFPLGEGERTYKYNPYDPTPVIAGVSRVFGGAMKQKEPNYRHDVVSFLLPPFEEDLFIRGKMHARLRVRSDCEDTCFYVRVSLVREDITLGLRDDIAQISNFAPDYRPGEELEMQFSFDEHALRVHKGERLRVDVSSAAFPLYIRHTNLRGLYCDRTGARIAENTVIAGLSELTVPVEI